MRRIRTAEDDPLGTGLRDQNKNRLDISNRFFCDLK